MPLLFFGVDETVDPARFALLPVPRASLAKGMIAAAFVGVPALLTLLTTSGLVGAAAIRFGPLAGAAALFGVLGGLTIGVVASRAVTSAFAALLRSRRVRDLAAVLLALLATSVGPIQWIAIAAVEHGEMGQAVRAADVVAWTPFGAPYALPFDVGAQQWDLVGARVAITRRLDRVTGVVVVAHARVGHARHLLRRIGPRPPKAARPALSGRWCPR